MQTVPRCRTHRTALLLSLITCTVAALLLAAPAAASDFHGQVTFGGFPVPGATVSVTQGTSKFSTVTDQGGLFLFTGLQDAPAKVEVEMQCFATIDADVTISPGMPAAKWELTPLPLDKLLASTKATPNPPPVLPSAASASKPAVEPETPAASEAPQQQEANEQAQDGFLINGSVNNAATSRFSLDQAFGNRRPNSRSLYTGGIAAIFGNSALDSRPYSLSGIQPPRPFYNRVTAGFTFGGPLRIPHVLRHGPNFFVAYQWTHDQDAETESGLVPTGAERMGDLSGLRNALGQPVSIFNPATGMPFSGNMVPVTPQAAALLQLFPMPNLKGNPLYNYQAAILNLTHREALQSRLDKTIGRRDELFGNFNFQRSNENSTNLFRFTDATQTFGINANVNWSHRFSPRFFVFASYHFSRLSTKVTPYFSNRQNVSGDAGVLGNDQDPTNWGPPTLSFSSGLSSLSDGNSSFNRARTDGFSGSAAFYRRRHNLTIGGDFRRQQFNDFFQQNPRGTFTFTGAATQDTAGSATSTGSDLADFLIGNPDASGLAFGNADKYLRESVYDAYLSDDWHMRSTLTINAGLRWQYGAPITELQGRLVNLDVASGFAAVAPVLGSDPVGSLTGLHYPSSLIRPDRRGLEPRIGFAWRPIPASTMVVRGGYGIYDDTSVYQTAALSLAQQAPLSKSLSVQNSAVCPLTLANGFAPCSASTGNTFAVDPNFRVGYAQIWELSVQRDLPAALQLMASYTGIKGTHGVQEFLPNTYPIGAANPCPACPSGFIYEMTGGNSTRQAGQVQLRRRLRSGFTASALYTFSKSTDDDAFLGGLGQGMVTPQSESAEAASPSNSTPPVVAQNWLDLRAERSLSSFDQRHLLKLQIQYTSGEGLGGRTLMTGWPGRFLKGWTFLSAIVVGSGMPETPVYLAAVPGTGTVGTIRPDSTGAPISVASGGVHLNSAAYTAPLPGQWGTAGRNSITGPGQFTLDASLARTFRPSVRFYLDARIDATNLLNHVVFTGWNTAINSAQFGLPLGANSMRSLQTSLRLRF